MKNKIRIIRLILYVLAFIYLLTSEVKDEYSFIFCPTKKIFNFDCYLCGMTRAFISMFHLNFKTALIYNPLVIIIYPLLIIFSIQDTFIIFKNFIKKENTSSFIEFIFGEK